MKYMIASDIHGSALYCEQMLGAYKREKADRLVLLGDILYHGPRNDLPEGYAPKEVTVMLNAVKNELLCVRGNCDTEVDQMVLEFPIMADYCFLELPPGNREGRGKEKESDNICVPRSYLSPQTSAASEKRGYPAERPYAHTGV